MIFDALFSQIQKLVTVTPEEVVTIKSFLQPEIIHKNKILLKQGEICNSIAFISKGYFRIYIQGDPKEVTVHLAGPGEFIAAYASFIQQKKSLENIQALTDAEIILISYEDLQGLYERSHNIERLGRLVLEQHFVKKEERVISFITEPADTRYKLFSENKPDFIKHIPLHYIASYLGIRPETLSRIRARF